MSTATTKKNTPELRFPGFSGVWSTDEFGNVVNLGKEKFNPKKNDGVLNSLELESIKKNTGEIIKYFSTQNLKSIKSVYRKGDVLYGKLRPYLRKFVYAKSDGVCTTEIWVLKTKKLNSLFLFYFIQGSKFNYFTNVSTGSKMPRAEWSYVSNSPIQYPKEKNEQEKISEFLLDVDNLILNLRKQQIRLEEHKRGIMEKIFSQEVRYKDDDGKDFPEWKKHILGDIAIFTKGKDISKGSIVLDGKNKCIRYGELYTHYSEIVTEIYSQTNVDPSKSYLSKKNDIILPSSGETAWDIATAHCVTLPGVLLGGDINVVHLKQDNDGVFFAYYLSNYKKRDIAKLAQGNSVVHLYNSHLSTLCVEIPCLKEQKKISNFLSAVDELITAKSEQIERAETWKKGLLQKMFI